MLAAPVPPMAEAALHCTDCAQRVTVLYVPSASASNLYECPHCHAVVRVFVPGVVIDWWPGHEDMDLPCVTNSISPGAVRVSESDST
jgi:hypothetical protein